MYLGIYLRIYMYLRYIFWEYTSRYTLGIYMYMYFGGISLGILCLCVCVSLTAFSTPEPPSHPFPAVSVAGENPQVPVCPRNAGRRSPWAAGQANQTSPHHLLVALATSQNLSHSLSLLLSLSRQRRRCLCSC